ncbi:hypothetical protein CY34DRAFT_802476 [Suillus luteus UH-Slu-Lm8-n1]|uniref:Uncharacterized protein n=1 Tax=Suillus luteus UH-Slu-Lm8-n1 TaxID=930992 RepID=A0A0D0ASC9_9AGAM|nr:hypothetical protein CY34DRAFT_802476 [Suillus luteus UH-Slu-Lm8-n1]
MTIPSKNSFVASNFCLVWIGLQDLILPLMRLFGVLGVMRRGVEDLPKMVHSFPCTQNWYRPPASFQDAEGIFLAVSLMHR